MAVVVVILVAVVALIGAVAFYRSVFGGSTFRRERRAEDDHDDRRGPRPDAHAGNSTWTNAGGSGRWQTWSHGP